MLDLASIRRALLSEFRNALKKGELAKAKALLPEIRSAMNNPFSSSIIDDPIAYTVNKFPQSRMSAAFSLAKKIKHFVSFKPRSNKPKEGSSIIVESKNGAGCIFLSAIPVSGNSAELSSSPFPWFKKFFEKYPGEGRLEKTDVYWISMISPPEPFSSSNNSPIKAKGNEAVIPFNSHNQENPEIVPTGRTLHYAEIDPMWDHSACNAITGKIFIREDFTKAPPEKVLSIFNETKKMQDAGMNIVFNCAAGNARSASILGAYLMEKHGKSLSESTKLIAEKRPQTSGFSARNAQQKAFSAAYFLDKFTNDNEYREKYFKEKSAETIAEDLFLCLTTDFKEADDYQATKFPGSTPYSDKPMNQLANQIIELKHSNKIPENKRQEIITLLANKMSNIPPRKDKIKCETPSLRQKEILSFLLPKNELEKELAIQIIPAPAIPPRPVSEIATKPAHTKPSRYSVTMFGGGEIGTLENAANRNPKPENTPPDQFRPT